MRWLYSKIFLYAAICAVVLLVLLALQARGWLNPVRYGIANIIRPLSLVGDHTIAPLKGFAGSVFSLHKIVSDNSRLQQQVQQLQQQLVELQQLREDNESLRKDLGFVQASENNLQPCTVLAIDPQDLADTFTLNCGSAQGIRVGQPVVAQGYLVGRVVYAGPLVSTAMAITNSQSTIDAKIATNQTPGVVKGSFGSGLIFDQIAQSAEVHNGDMIITAGINSDIPKNIIIGQVGSVISQSTDLFKRASVTSPINFHDLNFVFVIK